MPFEKTIVGKGENANNHHFCLFQKCFLPSQSYISILGPQSFIVAHKKPSIWKQEGHDGPGVAHMSLADCVV